MRSQGTHEEGLTLPRPLAFALSGGASLGAIQVGMLRALREAGITPELIALGYAGAAAFLAELPSVGPGPGIHGHPHFHPASEP